MIYTKTKLAMQFALIGVLLLVPTLYSIPSETIVYEAPVEPHETPEPDPIEEKVEPSPKPPKVATTYKTLHPDLVSVCSCESTGSPYNTPTHYEADGVTVLRGKINPKDIGMCQINLYYHGETAENMGLDLFVEADNIAYANFLYETQGFTPWGWSKPCHGK